MIGVVGMEGGVVGAGGVEVGVWVEEEVGAEGLSGGGGRVVEVGGVGLGEGGVG